MKSILVEVLILARLLTNDGVFLENRRPPLRKQPPEIFRFIRRPARKGARFYEK